MRISMGFFVVDYFEGGMLLVIIQAVRLIIDFSDGLRLALVFAAFIQSTAAFAQSAVQVNFLTLDIYVFQFHFKIGALDVLN